MSCKWILKDVKSNSVDKIFDTELDLDVYLANKWDELEQLSKKRSEETGKDIDILKELGVTISKVFDISPAEKADIILEQNASKIKGIIDKAKKTVFDGMEDEFIKLHDHPDYIGVTELISEKGNPKVGWDKPIVEKLKAEAYKQKLISEYRDLGFDENTAETLAENKIKSWEDMSVYGDDVHLIYQAVFQDMPMPKLEKLTDAQAKSVWKEVDAFKKSLIELYGKDVKFYNEFNMVSTNIDPDLKPLLEGKKGIAGTIDLLIRDSKGVCHIYDFKTSYKVPGEDNSLSGWHKNKRIAVTNQLAAYAVMLEQMGLEVGSTHIVPIKMDYTYDKNNNITGLINIARQTTLNNLPETLGGRTYNNWATMIPNNPSFDTATFNAVDRAIQFMLPVESVASQKIEKETADKSYYRGKVYKLSVTDPQANQNGKRYKYKFYPRELGKPAIFWEDDKAMEDGLDKFIQELKDARAKELDNLAINIQRAMLGELKLEELDSMLSNQKRDVLISQVRRYINNGWKFVRDKNLNAFGIFIFQKDGRSEIVGITNQHLGTAFNLSKGSSILGKTRYDKDVNSKDILDATTGNMELMRVMAYIAENQKVFENKKITQIKVLNPWDGSQYVELNSVLRNNYNLLVQDNSATYDGNLKQITEDIFYGDVTSILSVADELLADYQEKDWGIYDFDRKNLNSDFNKSITESEIAKQIWNLRRKYTYLNTPDVAGSGDVRVWDAYNNLLRALLAVRGVRMVQEFDIDQYLNSGAKIGTAINSTGFSPSANIRIFDDIMQEYATEVRTTVEKLGRPLVTALDAFYKSKGKNRIIGGEYTVFKEWFVQNPDGSIHESFSLKYPYDASLSEQSKNALKIWLETLAKVRWPNATPEDIQTYKESGVYYQVPLTEATFGKQAKSLGVLQAVRNKFAQYKELTQDVFAGETNRKMEWRSDFDRNWRLFNKFELGSKEMSAEAERASKLANNIGFYETDLEKVINQALVAYVKSNVSPKYISRLNALSVSLRLSASYGGQRQEQVEKVLNKLIDSKFYGESIIEGETMQAFARWLNVIKKGLSFMSLGFNMRSFVREFLQGTWMGVSRARYDTMPGVNKKTYTAGYEYVLANAYKNFNSVSLLQQLDALYGVANYSIGNIARKRRLDWTGIRNWNSDTAFWGSTAPDFQHRMGMLIAKMMGDGVFNEDLTKSAYYLNEEGDLVYDWTKDERFAICAAGLKSGDTVEFAKANPEFANQHALYMEHIAELNRLGKKFKDELGFEREYQEGDALPQAYLPREIQAIKNYADLLYGHYDDESRSLIHDMFLGSFFMQYKTYITSRIEQWTLNPGTYNTELLQWETDPATGEHLYKVHLDPDPDGRPNVVIKRESQIENLDQLLRENKIEKYYVWKGIPMEGIARSYINFFKRVKSLDWETIKEVKNNPIERDNLLLGLHDTLFASFMLLLITGIAGLLIDGEWTTDHARIAREAGKRGWLPSFMFNVSYGSFTDFAVWNNVWSIAGDWNPPALTAAKRLVSNAGAVILGDKTMFQAVTNTWGFAGDLRGIANNLAEN